jgi:enolase
LRRAAVEGSEVLDSRGGATVAIEVTLTDCVVGMSRLRRLGVSHG